MAKSVAARVRQRIAESEYTLTVHYPLLKTGATGTTPFTTAPVSPLVKAPAPTVPNTLYADPVREPVTLPCLFLDMSVLGEARKQRFKEELGGWMIETQALARVDKANVELEDGSTVFIGCDRVEVDGKSFQVLHVVKIGSSVSKDGSYYVLLKGAARN